MIKKYFHGVACCVSQMSKAMTALALAMLCLGLGTATVISTLSYYLSSVYKFSTQEIGFTFTVLAFSGILSNYFGAQLVDRLGCSRKKLVFTALVLVCSCTVIGFAHLSLSIWFVGGFILLFGIGSFSTSLSFTFSAHYSELELKSADAPMIASILRACLALSWVIGPPVAYLVIGSESFQRLYLLSAGLFGLAALIFQLYLPITTYNRPKTQGVKKNLPSSEWWVYICTFTLATTIIFAVNHAYLIGLPLHLSGHSSLNVDHTGILLGAAALMEIPMIIAFGFVAKQCRPIDSILLGTISGIIFFIGMSHLSCLWQLIGIQVLNAILISSISVGGLLYMQKLFRSRLAMGSSMYMNTMLAGSIAGSLGIASLPGDKPDYLLMQMLSAVLIVPLMLLIVLRVRES